MGYKYVFAIIPERGVALWGPGGFGGLDLQHGAKIYAYIFIYIYIYDYEVSDRT